MTEPSVILVTGATGKVGRHVVSGLLDAGADIRVLARDPQSVDLPDAVEVVRGDLSDAGTLDVALDGVESVFLLWPFFNADGAAAVVDVVKRHARRVVFLSAMGISDEPEQLADQVFHARIERLIEQSGLTWTFLRAGGFASNTLEWAPQIQADGVVRQPYGESGRSLIHERDIADVAVRALIEDGHAGAKYVLTGPGVLTQIEQVHAIGAAIGRPLRYEEIPPDEAREEMIAAWGDATFVDHALDYWATLVTEPEPVTSTVEDVLGRPARTFGEWAADHADDFRARSTAEVATEYVSLCRQGNFEEAMGLMSADVVRVAPMEPTAELRGPRAIMDNSARFVDDEEIHGVEVGGPFLADGDRFAVRFAIDATAKRTGERATTAKISLYTARGGLLVREEVYYLTPPASA